MTVDLDAVVRRFETFAPEDASDLSTLYTDDAYFKDPFNEVRRRADIEHIFLRMFETLIAPRFVVTSRIAQGDQAMLAWDFHFRIRRFRPDQPWTIRGATHLRFAPDGRIAWHRDYWDAAEELYAKLPAVGPLVRWLGRRMA